MKKAINLTVLIILIFSLNRTILSSEKDFFIFKYTEEVFSIFEDSKNENSKNPAVNSNTSSDKKVAVHRNIGNYNRKRIFRIREK